MEKYAAEFIFCRRVRLRNGPDARVRAHYGRYRSRAHQSTRQEVLRQPFLWADGQSSRYGCLLQRRSLAPRCCACMDISHKGQKAAGRINKRKTDANSKAAERRLFCTVFSIGHLLLSVRRHSKNRKGAGINIYPCGIPHSWYFSAGARAQECGRALPRQARVR